jgi:hypothetical protein
MKNNSINNKVNNMTKNVKTLANMLREDCKNLVGVAKTERDENGEFLTYKDKSKKAKFFMAYKKAKLHFGELARTEEGNKIAHIIFGKEAHESVEFRCTEEHYLKAHPEDKGFFDVSKYYDYRRRKTHEEKIQDKIAAENSAREIERVKAVESNGRRNRKIAAIVIVAIIAVAAFAVAVYKKGLKPVLKAIAFGACCVTVILAFRKAQDAVLDRIKNKFYGNK